VADAFYAPVAIRIAGYGLPVSARLRAYVNAILALPVIQEWREAGLAQDEEVSVYDMAPLERRLFPQQI
jgi:glutathione S-transferase